MMDNPDDLLQAVARAMAGDDGCCCLWDIDGRCCMTPNAIAVFKVIGERTGLTREWLEGAERIQADKRRMRTEAAK